MRKALAAIVLLCVFGAAPARADEWARFDTLVGNTKKSMMADPKAALKIAQQAEAIAQAQPNSPRKSEAVATGLWLEGEAFTRINQTDDARIAIEHAVALADGDGKTTRLDGDLALTQGRWADATGNFAVALKSYHRAHDIFAHLGIARYQSIALQGLGSIYDKAHDFDHMITYYRRASQVYSEDPALELSAANNTGYALQQLGRYDEAITDYGRALKIATVLDSPLLEARILTNLAVVQAKRHLFADAETSARRALTLLGPKDEYGWAPFVWGVKAEIEYERGRLDAAASDLERAFRGVDLKTTITAFRDMHQIAFNVYRAKGNYALALAHLEAFKRLDDQGRSLSASANLALMGAQFDFATQQFEIEHLQSEQLKRDISLRESRAAMQTVIFAALLLAGLLVIVWIGWQNLQARRHRKELTKTLGERDVEIERRTEVEAKLRFAMLAAERANLAKSHFLANMSHELRTPLNAIIGFSEIMTLGVLPPPKNQEYAADINTSGRKLLAVLNDILDMARIDAGSVTLDESDIRLGDVVDRSIALLDCEAPGHGKTIHVADENRDVLVRGDERRLRQILVNLLSNAVKFTGKDGSIDVRFEMAADGVDLIVSDNGVGIPGDKLGDVMDAFGQVESAYARSHGGVGLGLPIVKSLVQLHGGTFTLQSTVGHGTTARVHLPASRLLQPTANLQALAS